MRCGPSSNCGNECDRYVVWTGPTECCCRPQCGDKCSADPNSKCNCGEISQGPLTFPYSTECSDLTISLCPPFILMPQSCKCGSEGGSCGCGCSGNGANDQRKPSLPPPSLPFLKWRIAPCYAANYVPTQTLEIVADMATQPQPEILSMSASVGSISPSTGNLTLAAGAPIAGPASPVPLLTYNARAADQTIQFGHGWADLFNPTVGMIDSTAAELASVDNRRIRKEE